MQHHAADQLHIEMALAQCTLCRLADGGESGNEQIVKAGAVLDLLTELGGAGAQLLVAQGFKFGLQRIDEVHFLAVLAQLPVIGGAEQAFG